jgi:hypothetical protein
MAQLGGDCDSKIQRCRGLTEGATEEIEENKQGKLKRSRKTALTLNDLLDTVQTTDELSIGSGFTSKTNRPQGTLRYQPSANRDINSPHNDALFYFFLRNLDELLADFKSSSVDEYDSDSTQAFTIGVRPL